MPPTAKRGRQKRASGAAAAEQDEPDNVATQIMEAAKPPPKKRAKKDSTETTTPVAASEAETTTPVAVAEATTTTEAAAAAAPAAPKPARLTWEDRLQQLVEYKELHGDCLIPTRYKLNPSLGKWVHNQREQYKLFHQKTKQGYKKKCSMTAERIAKLEEVGFVWSTERTKRMDEEWQARFQQLQEYQQQNGHCMVPHGHKQDPSLAEWVHRQRTTQATMVNAVAKGKPQDEKVKQRMDLLSSIGFVFTVQNDNWKERWEQLRQYKELNGHCQVPTHFAENRALGRWVHTQRHQYRQHLKGKKSCMTEERIALLNQLGFNWEVRPALDQPRVTWQARLEELVEFQKEQGHFNVPADKYPQLHRWCQEQKQRLRQLQKHGQDLTKRMGPDRVAALQAIGFDGTPTTGGGGGGGGMSVSI